MWDSSQPGGGACQKLWRTDVYCQYKTDNYGAATNQMRGKSECTGIAGCAWDTSRNVRGGGMCAARSTTYYYNSSGGGLCDCLSGFNSLLDKLVRGRNSF